MDISELEDIFQQAASVESKLPDKERRKLEMKCGWPDYLYDLDDKKDQEMEPVKLALTSKQIGIMEKAHKWLNFLGMRKDKRTITGKRIIWARANGFSYRDIAFQAGVPPKTCENWYKADLKRILFKINL